MIGENLSEVVVFDENPIHVIALQSMVREVGCASRITCCHTVEELLKQSFSPDLVLVNIGSDQMRCAKLLLLHVLNRIPEVSVMVYFPKTWDYGSAFGEHMYRLIRLTYTELMQSFREALIRLENGTPLGKEGTSSKPLDATEKAGKLVGRLSPREKDILCLMGKGLGIVEVSGELGSGQETVKTHLKNIRGKLKINGIVEIRLLAAQYAQQGDCRVFSTHATHICPCRNDSVGNCPVNASF